ncbi:hypothetical protein E5676_scaffold255G006540 [Cucumis melo var. makuwa]|uniref:Uncharacterized protein LOC103485326 n=2 Tax=Cucumis melo TaxID=3656 RepID=A0A1S3B2N5_CUCME|nr:uncharacterized protein LOC103485326 [Cucumis melo]TYK13052.1 hypothetical protein E5676_scaffold255G006540 [Cucumis melo var. makuwa]
MGNCCKGQYSTPVTGCSDRRTPPLKNHRQRRHEEGSSCCSKETNLREVKIRMTKKELEELVGWLNMADSSFEHVMARLVNVINDQNGDNNNDQVVKLRQQRSWRPSLQSIPEII